MTIREEIKIRLDELIVLIAQLEPQPPQLKRWSREDFVKELQRAIREV